MPKNPIALCLESPSEADSNGEPANVVDGLFAIARAVGRLAAAVEAAHPYPVDLSLGKAIKDGFSDVAAAIGPALEEPTRAIEALANALRDVNNPEYRDELAKQAFINHREG